MTPRRTLVINVTNPGPNKVQVDTVTVVPTVKMADGVEGTCDPSDYQINGEQLPAEGTVALNWEAVELDAKTAQDSSNTVQFFDKTREAFKRGREPGRLQGRDAELRLHRALISHH